MQPTKAQRRFPLSELAAFFIAQKCHGKTGRRRQSEYSDCTVMAVATDFHRTSLLLWGKKLNFPPIYQNGTLPNIQFGSIISAQRKNVNRSKNLKRNNFYFDRLFLLWYNVNGKGVDLMNKIITVGREFGSGGRELARRLAQELNFDYYDKEIITEISKHTSLSEEYVKQVVEHRPHYLYPITTGQSISYVGEYAFQQVQTIYGAQSEIIKSMAEKSDCVIVGRCADYILRDYKPCRIFVYANIESRVKRCMERSGEDEKLTEKEMKRHILALDKERAKYYEFYTDRRWGDKLNYDLCINTSFLEIKKLVPEVAKLFK